MSPCFYADCLDSSLTLENVITVIATVKLELVNCILGIPPSIIKEIHQQSSTTVQKREKLICYFLDYSAYASWSDLASNLYYMGHHEALQQLLAARFIEKAPGLCVYNIAIPVSA